MTEQAAPLVPPDSWPHARRRIATPVGEALLFPFAMTFLVRAEERGEALWVALVLVAVVGSGVLGRWWTDRARARRRRAMPAGDPSWQADWTRDRGAAHAPLLARALPWSPTMLLTTAGALGVWFAIGIGIETRAGAAFAAGGVGAVVLVLAWAVFRGGAQVRFDRFPYRVGERARFFVATTTGGPPLRDARFLLRCLSPRSPRRPGDVRKTPWVVWSAERAAATERWPGPDEFVEVEFDVPADLPGTALLDEPPVRWELVVDGRTRWGRLTETFVVPVYAARDPGAA